MAKKRYLKNAPIQEALIDLRVRLSSGFDPKSFINVSEQLSAEYPKNEPRRLIAGILGVKEGKLITPEDKGVQGYFFKSEDEKNIVQFRMDGFTFSRLHPYTKWETVLLEAKRLWEIYHSVASPELITRIAVRYINRLDIELPIKDFGEYLTAPPTIPASLPQEISQFLNRMVIHEGDKTINLVQAMEPITEKKKIGIILDIDVFKIQESGFDIEDIWSEFEQLRGIKNRVFFESITEKTARLYE
ncbi:MAG: TIGR04255 family protein [Dehalococcoidales bacterium]|nr:TIGR04255 family protein [Dehalococcoidales bacterium]